MITIIGCGKEERLLLTETVGTALFVMSAEGADLDITFVGRERIRTLNASLRGVDRVTDVLSFPTLDHVTLPLKKEEYPLDLDPESGNVSLGSIVICKSKAKEQAEEYGHSMTRELCYLTVHGVLHLLGFDHILEEDRIKMREAEEKILSRLGIGR